MLQVKLAAAHPPAVEVPSFVLRCKCDQFVQYLGLILAVLCQKYVIILQIDFHERQLNDAIEFFPLPASHFHIHEPNVD